MEIEVVAFYENGVLRPERPLAELKEGQRVRLVIRASRAIASAGLLSGSRHK